MEQKTAIIFGATGLVGSELLELLVADNRYLKIKVFGRRLPGITDDRIISRIVDLADVKSWSSEITGDELYICLGTTIKKAGSIAAMEVADRDVPAEIARVGRDNGVKAIAVVSSIGADPGARNYYLRIKGEMETEIAGIGYDRTVIVRPSMLLGKRDEYRFGEEVGKAVMKAIRILFIGKMRKYRGIEAIDVAKGMIRLLNTNPKPERIVFESDEL
jgi:uncharacterized protein YbjT (DUF2867 family)